MATVLAAVSWPRCGCVRSRLLAVRHGRDRLDPGRPETMASLPGNLPDHGFGQPSRRDVGISQQFGCCRPLARFLAQAALDQRADLG
jgi:hypothetical protein